LFGLEGIGEWKVKGVGEWKCEESMKKVKVWRSGSVKKV